MDNRSFGKKLSDALEINKNPYRDEMEEVRISKDLTRLEQIKTDVNSDIRILSDKKGNLDLEQKEHLRHASVLVNIIRSKLRELRYFK